MQCRHITEKPLRPGLRFRPRWHSPRPLLDSGVLRGGKKRKRALKIGEEGKGKTRESWGKGDRIRGSKGRGDKETSELSAGMNIATDN